MTESTSTYDQLEEEVVIVKKELENFQTLYHHNFSSIKASEELNNIQNRQTSPLIKSSLGYEQGSSSSHLESKESTNLIKFHSSKLLENSNVINIEAWKDNNKNETNSGKKES